jgi:hypothetical protein
MIVYVNYIVTNEVDRYLVNVTWWEEGVDIMVSLNITQDIYFKKDNCEWQLI